MCVSVGMCAWVFYVWCAEVKNLNLFVSFRYSEDRLIMGELHMWTVLFLTQAQRMARWILTKLFIFTVDQYVVGSYGKVLRLSCLQRFTHIQRKSHPTINTNTCCINWVISFLFCFCLFGTGEYLHKCMLIVGLGHHVSSTSRNRWEWG